MCRNFHVSDGFGNSPISLGKVNSDWGEVSLWTSSRERRINEKRGPTAPGSSLRSSFFSVFIF